MHTFEVTSTQIDMAVILLSSPYKFKLAHYKFLFDEVWF
jgi:hypothetical protein